MNFRAVFHLVSFLPIVLGLCMLLCWAIGTFSGDSWVARWGFAVSAAIALIIGITLWTFTRGPVDLNRRDGVGIVTFGWLLSTLIGAIPFVLSGTIPDLVGAWFESVSGFTTTGATILTNLEAAPRAILLWRALTHFLGGMGILVLCVAILPLLGSGGMQIYRAEAAGPSKDRLTPRIANTAKLLWGVYVGMALVLTLLLALLGVSWFDAVCHSFATVATGGFSTYTASIAAFKNPAIEWVLAFFMFLAGINFALHWRVFRGDAGAWFRDPEWRLYVLVILSAVVLIALNAPKAHYENLHAGIRGICFTVISILTTTGFSTDDYVFWPALSQYVLLILMFLGGCAGSTAGGIKMVRVLVLLKQVAREMKLFIQPQAIYHVKIGRQMIESEIVSMIGAFFIIFILIFAGASAAMMPFVPDLKTAISAVVAALGNVGPGLGQVGPAGNYEFVPTGGKLILTLCMLLGRLELYTMLVVLFPSFWRR